MINITHYLKIIYSLRNRGYPFLNCWGLVCEFYHIEKGIELDKFEDDDMRSLDKCYLQYRKNLKEISKRENCIIAFFKNGIIVHVGIMLAGDKVLHTDRRTMIQPLRDIMNVKQYNEVRFYDAL